MVTPSCIKSHPTKTVKDFPPQNIVGCDYLLAVTGSTWQLQGLPGAFWKVTILPYFDKRKQLLKMSFLVNLWAKCVCHLHWHQCNLSLWLKYFSAGCFCSKLDLEVEPAKSNLKTSISQIVMICHLLAFVRIGQHKAKINNMLVSGNMTPQKWVGR